MDDAGRVRAAQPLLESELLGLGLPGLLTSLSGTLERARGRCACPRERTKTELELGSAARALTLGVPPGPPLVYESALRS